jgi:hypothetical protein
MGPQHALPTEQGRAIPHVQAPSNSPLAATAQQTEIYTYFTRPNTTALQLYNGNRTWAKIILTLETAGPVAISNKQTMLPVLSGKGQLLQTGVAREFICPKGTILYVASTSINRVGVVVEPLPWLEQLLASSTQDVVVDQQILGELHSLNYNMSALVAALRGTR